MLGVSCDSHLWVTRDTHLVHVAVKTDEIEDAAAVHLGGMEAAHHGNRAGGSVGQEGGGGGGGGHLREEHWVRYWSVQLPTNPPVPAVGRQRQQGAVWACTQTHSQREEACGRTRLWTQQRHGTVAVGGVFSQDGLTLPPLPTL